ncbi:unnamed protein product [Rotaria magnacalcarata]|uniref:F-box domain-containing protein n=1 Tax=Rotaria magnacalcarata TaxID=392030 RepID=A0A819VVE7_9BILA|nr:unnamed protein product [Rotaria magnacalcarata]
MSNHLVPSLATFPTEIIYRIFDNLNAETILSSFRCTCRRLKSLVHNYDRFILNFVRISKVNFELICRLINPEQVIKLILSHEEKTLFQIDLFISHFENKYFNRIRSLSLLGIDERHLKFILKYTKKSTATLLSSIVSQKNLRRLEFEIPPRLIPSPTWPVQSMIQYLRIGGCTHFYPCTILQCLPMLKTISVSFRRSENHYIVLADASTTKFTQLNSLSFENLSTKIEILESLLLLIPSLNHFKLIGNGNFLDDIDYNHTDIESIIKLFQTLFWLEYKKWFVKCEYKINLPRSILLYSIPICISSMIYQIESTINSLSTYDIKYDKNLSIMNNIKTIQIDFSKISLNNISNQVIINLNIQIFFDLV